MTAAELGPAALRAAPAPAPHLPPTIPPCPALPCPAATRAGILYISEGNQWANMVESWVKRVGR
jgi:hypothetical protein